MLRDDKCIPCKAGGTPLTPDEIESLRKELSPEWQVIDNKLIFRKYIFPDFKQALSFTNQIGAQSEKERHHPDITLGYGYVEVKILTHKIDGLSKNDFILADKIEAEFTTYH